MDEVFRIIYPSVLVLLTEVLTCPCLRLHLHLCSSGPVKDKPGGSGMWVWRKRSRNLFFFFFGMYFLGILLPLFDRSSAEEKRKLEGGERVVTCSKGCEPDSNPGQLSVMWQSP